MAPPDAEPALSSVRGPLRAIGSVVLPSPDALDPEGWRKAEAIMEQALNPRPTKVKRQLRLFLRLVNLLPLFSMGRTLTTLSLERRVAFLERLQRSSLQPLRRGLWGVRTLIFMGYYNQDSVRENIGYAAHLRGWKGRLDQEADGTEPGEGGSP